MKNMSAILLRKFLFFYISPLLICFAAGIYLLVWVENQNQMVMFEADEKKSVDLQVELIRNKLDMVVEDLHFLSDLLAINELLETWGEDVKEILGEEFLAFCRNKGIYDQIRFIRSDGMEVIRVNYNSGAPMIVPRNQLQNKGNRYYFKDSISLGNREVYVSPFDLNVEKGQIERPLKPMIRFATPVYGEERVAQGILILNYLGADLLDIFSQLPADPHSHILLNHDGYWLKSPNPEDEWGFMFPDRREANFAIRHPDAWSRISKKQSGQFRAKSGVLTFDTVYPLEKSLRSSTGSPFAEGDSSGPVGWREYKWKVVSHLPEETLLAGGKLLLRKLLPAITAALLIASCFLWWLANTREIRKKAERDLRKAHESLETKVEERTKQIEIQRATLEERVKERTTDLQRLKDDAESANIMLQQEINARKKASEELAKEKVFSETLINSLPGVFYLISEEGRQLRRNKNLETVTGYSDEEIDRLHVLEMFPENERKRIENAISEIIPGEEANMEANILTKNGVRIPYFITSRKMAIYNEIFIIGAGSDISELKKAEAELRRNMHELERLSKLIYGREQMMISLKEEINQLLIELGKREKYMIVER